MPLQIALGRAADALQAKIGLVGVPPTLGEPKAMQKVVTAEAVQQGFVDLLGEDQDIGVRPASHAVRRDEIDGFAQAHVSPLRNRSAARVAADQIGQRSRGIGKPTAQSMRGVGGVGREGNRAVGPVENDGDVDTLHRCAGMALIDQGGRRDFAETRVRSPVRGSGLCRDQGAEFGPEILEGGCGQVRRCAGGGSVLMRNRENGEGHAHHGKGRQQ